ncbi:MAG: hypothetical protein MMC23_002308 [Stictis urceolatum]|nr:hypothetical protein [Stictis urceolata]
MLEQLLQDQEGTDLIKGLEFVACAGAPMAPAVGDKVSPMVKLFHFIGSTETFPLPELSKSPSDWLYHEFNPNLKLDMQLFDPDKRTYELMILADEDNKDHAPLYHNLPGVKRYETKDLYEQHPDKPGLFKYYGRRDDIVVFANGLKINPVPLEEHVEGHPLVKGALMVGKGRTQPTLLIEPREFPDASGRADFLTKLWPRVKESNSFVSAQAPVARDKMVCASSDKPFPRTGKGNIIRKKTEEAFKDEIDSLYSTS